jgi:hypothetical protein
LWRQTPREKLRTRKILSENCKHDSSFQTKTKWGGLSGITFPAGFVETTVGLQFNNP